MSFVSKMFLYLGFGLIIMPVFGLLANGLPRATTENIIMYVVFPIVGLLIVLFVFFIHYRGFDMNDIKALINKFKKK
jgi:FtsH-binding integral membrane protein